MKRIAKGRVTITRPHGFEQERIEISITDDSSRVEFCTAIVSLEAFAKALTGQAYIECQIETRGLHLVGMRAEHKEEIVPVPKDEWNIKDKRAKELLAPFEVDGWKGQVDDLGNGHRRTKDGYRVTFRRHVPASSCKEPRP